MNWVPIWALPNLDLDNSVDGGPLALVPASDQRIIDLENDHPNFKIFMDCFEDTHKNPIRPTLIISRETALDSLRNSDAATGFRDLLVASMVPISKSRDVFYNNHRGRITYSSFFWVHPWMIDKNFEHIIAHTPAILALHEVEAFRGQSSPELFQAQIKRRDFDEPLLEELLRRWTSQYVTQFSERENIALFRSLNIANQACQLPAGVDATIHDYGRIIGLWVSAFEILVHPGENGRANVDRVFELLDNIPWVDKRCRHRRYKVVRGRKTTRRDLASWNYNLLNNCRNKFLHGNPVEISDLKIYSSGRILNDIASSLYRLALTSFLDLRFKDTPPPEDSIDEFVEYHNRKHSFEIHQREAEQALKLSRTSIEDQERLRNEAIQQARIKSDKIKQSIANQKPQN